MKKEIYSCLKMLESLKYMMQDAYNRWKEEPFNRVKIAPAFAFKQQYNKIYGLLIKYLSPEEKTFLPMIQTTYTGGPSADKELMQELISAADISISFLNSLDMDLNTELKNKKNELEYKEKELEHMKRLLDKSLDAIKTLPEFIRSKIVEETKKSHRAIEANSKAKK